ncbi:MAG: hypothetical protein Q8T13_06195 [Acidobacteriota bacterium]|nr:hypothetical protein [Acidobacteriota bacterium]
MKTLRVAFVAAALVLFASAAHAQQPALGTWDLTTISPEGEFKSVMEVREEAGKLVAVGKSPQGERKYDSVALEGTDITMVITVDYNGMPLVITYTGKIDGTKIEGQTDYGGMATGTFTAVRK